MNNPADKTPWDPNTMTPYIHWYENVMGGKVEQLTKGWPPRNVAQKHTDSGHQFKGVTNDQANLALRRGYSGKEAIPIHPDVVNRNINGSDLPDDFGKLVDTVDPDSVIIGVVDEGISIGHDRFRYADGRTRVLASWQQGATFGGAGQDFLPFGYEIYQSDINAALRTHSTEQDLTKTLDETAFNRALKLSEPHKLYYNPAVDRDIGHGTAVLDLAAGEDAAQISKEDLKKRPIIAVNLPRRQAIGMAGTYLEFFVVHAIARIVKIADTLWERSFPGQLGGFPVVINLSYGQQAGAKDANSIFENAIAKMISNRTQAPLRVVMPVGNDNLERCNIRSQFIEKYRPKDGQPFELEAGWSVQPEDHTSNFVEIWTESMTIENVAHPCPLEITLTHPNGDETLNWTGSHGKYHHGTSPLNARIYCAFVPTISDTMNALVGRYRYLVCLPPTAEFVNAKMRCEAGVWQLQVRSHEQIGHVYMNIQVDQSPEPGNTTSKRSYFSHENYRKYLKNGRLRDSYAYPVPHNHPDHGHDDAWDEYGPIQRKGTNNSLANNENIIVVGGFRVSDGAPALYSATTSGSKAPKSIDREFQENDHLGIMTASYPSETGTAHFGIMAAGNRSGATRAVRGTSFATALATRHVVNAILAKHPHRPDDIAEMAQKSEKMLTNHCQNPFAPAHPFKRGHGRVMADHSHHRVHRLDR